VVAAAAVVAVVAAVAVSVVAGAAFKSLVTAGD
jgi:hypothetical protein